MWPSRMEQVPRTRPSQAATRGSPSSEPNQSGSSGARLALRRRHTSAIGSLRRPRYTLARPSQDKEAFAVGADADLVRRLTDEAFIGGNMAVFDEVIAADFVSHDP